MTKREMTGMEELREAVKMFDACNENFNDKFTVAELLQLRKMALASEWEFYPDEWSPRQIEEALKGKPPKWNDNETPNYDD